MTPPPYRFESCRRYVAKMPAAVSGAGGQSATFAVACVAASLFYLDPGGILAILAEYNPGAPGLRSGLVGA